MSLAFARPARGAFRRATALVALLLPAFVAAQTGTIAGTVVDGGFGGGLPGASVLVQELGTGAATDIDGNYRIQNVPVGTYTVQFSFIGYGTQTVNNVEVAAGETTEINIELSEGAELAEVVVEAEEIIETNSEVGLLRVRSKAAQVSDAISAEVIARSGAGDAADAAERITGASVVGGKFVFVRGLGDRYANTQLNGATLPTADPDRRAVQFDLFPSGLLNSITTLKTFTPDQQGSFSGGLINIETRAFPPAFTASLSASAGANSQTHFNGDVLTAAGPGVPLTGFSSGRDVPGPLRDGMPIPSATDVRFDPAGAQALQNMSRLFATPFSPVEGAAPLNQSYSGSIGNRIEVAGNPLGFIVGANWGRSASYYGDGVTARFSGQGTETSPFAPDFVATDTRGTDEVTWGGIANATYQVGGNNEFSLNTLFTRTAESEARFLAGPAPQIGNFLQQRVQEYTERQVASGQFRGRHLVPSLGGFELEYRASYSETELSQPDLRFFNNTIDTLFAGTDRERVRFGITGTSIPDPLRYYRDLDESLAEGAVDLSLPLRRFGIAGEVKVGGLYGRTDRAFGERRFQYNVRVPVGEVGLEGTSPEEIAAFFDQNLGAFTTRDLNDGRTRVDVVGTTLEDQTDEANQYQGTLDVGAGYGMVEVPLFDRLRVIAGARVETTDLQIEGTGVDRRIAQLDRDIEDATGAARDSLVTLRDGAGTIDAVDVLPALNLVYAVTDQMNVRAAATRTLARPTFREIAPFAAQDFGLGELLSGNPNLDRTLITNLDLRWEWFARPGDIFAVSGYYKLLDNPIERVIIDANGQTSFRNVEEAEIFGAEFEARTGLAPLASALDGFSLGANLTLTQSTISRSAEEVRLGANPERALQGQSPYLLNLDLAYENPERGTAAGLYFNVFGRRLSRVSQVGTPDVYEESAPTLDLVASQRVLDEFSLKLSVKNLLDTSFREVYDIDGAAVALPFGLEEPVFQRYDRGINVSLGLSYSPRFGGGPPPAVPSPSDTAPLPGN